MTYGSFQGFLTGEEIWEYLNRWHARHPKISLPPKSIGLTLENRKIPIMCIGSTCSDQASNTPVPAVLLTSLIHSREPMSLASIIYFLNIIELQQASGDPKILALLSSRQIWIAPLLNPDGYFFNLNRKNNELGQRKNRNSKCPSNESNGNGDGPGVDLNRNFPVCFNFDNKGSRNNLPCVEDYGIQAMDRFIRQHTAKAQSTLTDITIALNYHSYGRLINIPYMCKHEDKITKDLFLTGSRKFFRDFYEESFPPSKRYGWKWGTPYDDGLYTVNGAMSDWMYHDHNIVAMSPEMGPKLLDNDWTKEREILAFWPKREEILPLAKESLQMNFLSAWLAGPLPRVKDVSYTFNIVEKICSFATSFVIENTGLSAVDNNNIYSWLLPEDSVFKNTKTFPKKIVSVFTEISRLSMSAIIHVSMKVPCSEEDSTSVQTKYKSLIAVNTKSLCVVFLSSQSVAIDISTTQTIRSIELLRSSPQCCKKLTCILDKSNYFDHITENKYSAGDVVYTAAGISFSLLVVLFCLTLICPRRKKEYVVVRMSMHDIASPYETQTIRTSSDRVSA
eukprot:GSMAST32.ASY1.ANO1.2012.1 assembled CDS